MLPGRRAFALRALALAAIVGAAYAPALRAGFIWDDDDYVTRNPTLQSGRGLWDIWTQPGATAQYYPLVHTSFWLEHRLAGIDPRLYHADNLLLHAAGAILLYRLLLALAVPGAWLAAAVFAAHPVQVESVAWVTERKNVLAGVFYFSSLALLWTSLRTPESAASPAGRRRRLAALALYAAALLSKTVTCTLPIAAALIVWWKRGSLSRREGLSLVPFALLGAALGAVTIGLERLHVGAHGVHWELSLPERVLVAGRALWFYLGKLAWPSSLSFIYPRWDVPSMSPAWSLLPAAWLAAFGLAWRCRERIGRAPAAAQAFFTVTLLPALGFVDFYPMRYSYVADHFQYLASAGPVALAVGAAVTLAARSRAARLAAGTLALATLAVLTSRQTHNYRDVETLWRATLVTNPDGWLPHNNLGTELEQQGRLDEAGQHYAEAVRVSPESWESQHNYAMFLLQKGLPAPAESRFREALRRHVDADSLSGLGRALSAQGRTDEALEAYRASLAARPGQWVVHQLLGATHARRAEWGPAAEHYREALALNPACDACRRDLAAIASAAR